MLLDAPLAETLTDPFGRAISYLRISVTDRCDLRCVYCMSETMTFLPKAEVLELEELERIAAAFIRLGTRKIRITGGEPLGRRNVLSLFRALGAGLPAPGADSGAAGAGAGLRELSVTTNGTMLAGMASDLASCGVSRVNVSLDTLDPALFARITRGGRIGRTLDGIFAARDSGMAVKINAVALRGINEDSLSEMVAWCGQEGLDLCLIETMPMGDVGFGRLDQYLPLSAVRVRLRADWTLEQTDYATGGPARYYTVAETGRRIGFITPMTHNFCESCNRVRLTCTGTLFLCLGQDDQADLRAVLRSGASDAELDAAIRAAVARKPRGHDFVLDRRTSQPAVTRHMSVTGG